MGEKQAADSREWLPRSGPDGGRRRCRADPRGDAPGRLIRIIVMVGIPTAYLWYRIAPATRSNMFNLPRSTRCC